MKKIFFSILITFLIGMAVVIGIGFIKKADYVAKSHSSVEVNRTWKVALAHYVNNTGLSLSVDEKEVDDRSAGDSYLADDLELMLERETVTDVFHCAVNLYDGENLSIARGDTSILVGLDHAKNMHVNGKKIKIDHAPVVENEELFIPADIIAEGIGYSYDWNPDTKTVSMNASDPGAPLLPTYYNYAEIGKLSAARDQGSLGTCWAFAALSAAESALMPEEDLDFSEDHMLHHNGFRMKIEEGGDHLMAMAYLTNWTGPVLEADDPYGDGESNANLSAVRHVQEIQTTEKKDYEKIKEMVFLHGAVESSIYIALLDPTTIDPDYYDAENGSYYYPEKEVPNHEIVIIGWDDQYPKEQFRVKPKRDGAFICRNSWGSNFGFDGIFYVSYEDTVIGSNGEVYTRIEKTDNYDHIYQYDPCGWLGRIGYSKNHAFFANIYTPEGEEDLEAVSFYATGPNTTYKVYAVTGADKEGMALLTVPHTPLAEGTFENGGYYTVKLNEPLPLVKGQDVAVIVEIDTPGSSHPIAMETNSEEMENHPVELSGKRSYISNYGDVWEHTQQTSQCNVCLKMFTNNR